jgi:autoinducer-2 kinase
MLKTYLVFDIGTGNSKAALVNSNGEILGIKTIENQYDIDKLYTDAHTFNPSIWKDRLLCATDDLIHGFPDLTVDAVTASGARQSVVLYNDKNEAFLGLPNIDNRGRDWMHEITGKDEIYFQTGKWVTEDFIAGKIMGLCKRRNTDYCSITKITSLSEWLGGIFCEKTVIEPSQACETQLFDINKMDWSEKLCQKYGIDASILPQIQTAGTKLGAVIPNLRKRFGFKESIPFIIGGADTQLAVKGALAKEDEIVVISGTTSPVVMLRKDIYHDAEKRCWTDCNLKGNSFLIETNPGVTGLNFQRFKSAFLADIDYQKLDKEMDNRYKSEDGFSCFASFTSLLFSQRKGLKTGGFIMKSPFSNYNRIDFACALIEDIACAIYKQYLSLCDMIEFKKNFIRGCGGGFKSPVLSQMLADLTGKKIVLERGFVQASIKGCIEICNEYFSLSENRLSAYKIYEPHKKDFLENYFKKWNENRLLLNS